MFGAIVLQKMGDGFCSFKVFLGDINLASNNKWFNSKKNRNFEGKSVKNWKQKNVVCRS